ncbi:MIP/aquaporin family protein [Spiroplasma endosymbiont of Aspidapion aeneum]|uniref:MIP/aquaporin family protein n=1 Tax=Spiroplasma endosymbiont of Aspidapion aeneum TaxID=3066276 RepID=UPI00313C0265
MNFLQHFLVEGLGTMILIVLGNGVVGNVVLKKNKGYEGGWLLITVGWGLAVTMAALICIALKSDAVASFNPALTVALCIDGLLKVNLLAIYLGAELIGAFIGQIIVDLLYVNHIKVHLTSAQGEEEKKAAQAAVLGLHSTGPAIRSYFSNFLCEFVATSALILGIVALALAKTFAIAPFVNPFFAGALVSAIGICLGGLTGFAINPARDLMPRIVHTIFYRKEGGSDWKYAWVPVMGPMAAGVVIGCLMLI